MAAGFYLKPNHTTRIPQTVVVAHCSQKLSPGPSRGDEIRKFRTGYAVRWRTGDDRYLRKTEREVFSELEFWEWVRQQTDERRPAWLFLHGALHQCTYLQLWRELDEGRFWLRHYGDKLTNVCDNSSKGTRAKPGFLCIADRPFIAELKCGQGRIKIVDIRNYLNETVADLCKQLPDTIDHIGDEWRYLDTPTAPAAEVVEVLAATVERLLRWWKDNDCGVWKTSIGGLAWNNFRHRHMHHAIQPTTDPDTLRLEQDSYYGGIVECRFRGVVSEPWNNTLTDQTSVPIPGWGRINGPLYHLDISSMYPSIMAAEQFPTRNLFHRVWRDGDNIKDLMNGYAVIANVEIRSGDVPFPVRLNLDVRHCVGTMRTVLAGPELALGISLGVITRIFEVSAYVRGRIFKSYAGHWLEQRLIAKVANHAVHERFSKLMANSLYGRFAMRRNLWKDRPDKFAVDSWSAWPEYDQRTNSTLSFRSIAHYVQQLDRHSVAPGSFPAVAAYVTSYGRVLMRQLLADLKYREVVYVDTDGLIVTQGGYDKLVASGKLSSAMPGCLRCVRVYNSGEIVGCRNYRLDEDSCTAGLPTSARQVGPTSWEFPAAQGPADIIKRKPDGTVRFRRVKWSYDDIARNGYFDASGWLIPSVTDGTG